MAALQRLANAVGVRLLADSQFRNELFQEGAFDPNYNFEDDRNAGVVIFRIVVPNNDYGTRIREFEIIFPRSYQTGR